MSDESVDNSRIRILNRVYPVSSETIKGVSNEPLVVKRVWPDGSVERRRVVNPERSYQVPTFVFWDATVTPEQQDLIREAFDEMYDAIGFDKTQLHIYGNWRDQEYRDNAGNLLPHRSIEWQVQSKYDASKRQVNADRVAIEMFNDPYQLDMPHWEVIFTNKDLYSQETNFVIGIAQPDLGTLISLKRLESIGNIGMRGEAQKTEIFHEVGHVFGLPTGRRGQSELEYSLGAHCRSVGCSMKQGLKVPTDWINFTEERLKVGGKPYCDECVADLETKFHRKKG
jgi:predicted Zn-dependent protease